MTSDHIDVEVKMSHPTTDVLPLSVHLDKALQRHRSSHHSGPPKSEPTGAVKEMTQRTSDIEKAPARQSTLRKIFRSLLYVWPLTAGFAMPIVGALNAEGKATCGSLYFVVAVTYTIDAILSGLWAHYTSNVTISENYFDVGLFIFECPRVHIFCLFGGVLGATQHVIIGLVSAAGGSSIFTLGSLTGSIITGILIDSTGICWAPKMRPSILILIGAAGIIVGAVLHSLPVLKGDGTESTNQGKMIFCLCISALSGLCMCVQACFGNKLASLIGGFRRAAVWSFLSGSLVLYLIGPYIVPDASLIEILRPRNWWKLSQAPLAAYCLVAVAVSQRKMSGAIVYCWLIIGQLIGSTLLDSFGWIGLIKRPIDKYKIVGLVVVLMGVSLVTASKLVRGSPILTESPSTTVWDPTLSDDNNFIESATQRSSSIVALSTQRSHL